MSKRFALPVAVAAILAGGVALGLALSGHDGGHELAETRFSIYDHDAIYWVYARQDTLCEAAQRSIDLGNTERVAIDHVQVLELPADVAADGDAVLYLRGMLHGCVDWGA